ncbi:MAG: hypothetical protein K0R44_3513 [Thermomicrobiales bacterium]|nr:hypothetical protein [Thermomicrobiales bacterium]
MTRDPLRVPCMMLGAVWISHGCDEVMGITLTPSVDRNVAQLAQPLAASIPITIFSLAAVSLPLAAAQSLGLSSRQTGTWLFALCAAPGLASIVLTLV